MLINLPDSIKLYNDSILVDVILIGLLTGESLAFCTFQVFVNIICHFYQFNYLELALHCHQGGLGSI